MPAEKAAETVGYQDGSHNLITELTSSQHCCNLLARSKLLRLRGLHKGMNTRKWGLMGAFTVAACHRKQDNKQEK